MAAVQRMERIETGAMEPTLDGSFAEYSIEKFAWMCLGCRLVWSRKAHAEDCEARGHVSTWEQRYVTGPIVNGVPYAERFYPRTAIRREKPAAVAILATAADLDQADALADEYQALCDRADAISDEYASVLRLANLAKVSKGIYRVSMTGKEAKYGLDYLNVQLTPSEAYGSVKLGEYNGESVGVIKRDGSLMLWPDVDSKNQRVVAILVAVEIILGSHDPIALAKAYAAESETCWRCGADLVDELSRQVLMGATCYRAEYGLTQRQGIKAGVGVDAHEVDDDQALDSDPYDVDMAS